jgi:seryl-tRNA synthetase
MQEKRLLAQQVQDLQQTAASKQQAAVDAEQRLHQLRVEADRVAAEVAAAKQQVVGMEANMRQLLQELRDLQDLAVHEERAAVSARHWDFTLADSYDTGPCLLIVWNRNSAEWTRSARLNWYGIQL